MRILKQSHSACHWNSRAHFVKMRRLKTPLIDHTVSDAASAEV